MQHVTKMNNEKREYVEIYSVLKQGELLSLFLFICFINDMYEFLYDHIIDVFSLGYVKPLLLIFVYATVLFSYLKWGVANTT